MKKEHPDKSAMFLKNEIENKFGETTNQKIVITDECGDTLWDEILKQDENILLSKVNRQNNQPVEEVQQLKGGENEI